MSYKTRDQITPDMVALPEEDEDKTVRVGLGVTQVYGYGGIRYAGTIVAVERNGQTVVVQTDTSVVKAGQEGTFFGGNIEYDYFANPHAPFHRFTRRKDGSYRGQGEQAHYATRLTLGYRHEYVDPSL